MHLWGIFFSGGFALVFLTRDNTGKRYALKRMFVNKEQDLLMCQQEIRILVSNRAGKGVTVFNRIAELVAVSTLPIKIDHVIKNKKIVATDESIEPKEEMSFVFMQESLVKEPDSPIVRYYASVIKDVDEEVKEILILLEYYKCKAITSGSFVKRIAEHWPVEIVFWRFVSFFTDSVLQLMNERFQAKKNLGEEELLNIFCDVCHAVSKLHTHRPPWIHRDLK